MKSNRWLAILGWVACLVVAGSVVYGLMRVGGPGQARREKADFARVEQLESLVRGVKEFYRSHKALPKSLAELPSANILSSQDPVTKAPYEYRVLEPHAFELCAVFETDQLTPSTRNYPYDEILPFWKHGIGRRCFRITVGR